MYTMTITANKLYYGRLKSGLANKERTDAFSNIFNTFDLLAIEYHYLIGHSLNL